jgi:hypothetical protein
MEYEELARCISNYSNKIFQILTGLVATAIAIVWYDLQKPGNTDLLNFVSSIVIHPAAIYLIYCYIVYRTLKTTKAIQAERINALLGKEPALLWEEVWHKIWSNSAKGITHSVLGWLFIFLFFSVHIGIVLLTSKNGVSYLGDHYAKTFYYSQASLLCIELVVSFHYIHDISQVLKQVNSRTYNNSGHTDAE